MGKEKSLFLLLHENITVTTSIMQLYVFLSSTPPIHFLSVPFLFCRFSCGNLIHCTTGPFTFTRKASVCSAPRRTACVSTAGNRAALSTAFRYLGVAFRTWPSHPVNWYVPLHASRFPRNFCFSFSRAHRVQRANYHCLIQLHILMITMFMVNNCLSQQTE